MRRDSIFATRILCRHKSRVVQSQGVYEASWADGIRLLFHTLDEIPLVKTLDACSVSNYRFYGWMDTYLCMYVLVMETRSGRTERLEFDVGSLLFLV